MVSGDESVRACPADDDGSAHHAHALDVEVGQLVGHPLGRQLVGRLGLLALVERRDRGKGVLACSHDLVADESRLSGEGVCEVSIDAVQRLIDGTGPNSVGADAGKHGDAPC